MLDKHKERSFKSVVKLNLFMVINVNITSGYVLAKKIFSSRSAVSWISTMLQFGKCKALLKIQSTKVSISGPKFEYQYNFLFCLHPAKGKRGKKESDFSWCTSVHMFEGMYDDGNLNDPYHSFYFYFYHLLTEQLVIYYHFVDSPGLFVNGCHLSCLYVVELCSLYMLFLTFFGFLCSSDLVRKDGLDIIIIGDHLIHQMKFTVFMSQRMRFKNNTFLNFKKVGNRIARKNGVWIPTKNSLCGFWLNFG